MQKTILNFLQLTRAYSLSVTIASCLVILSYAHYSENFSWFNFIVMTIALCSIHLGANLFDDYIDVKTKLKKGIALKDIYFNSFTPKAKLITQEIYSLNQVKTILMTLFGIGLLSGLYFTLITGWQVLIFALIGGILTLFYPISSRYYLAEITIGLIYGPLIIMGGYFGLSGEFNSDLLLFSFAIFFSTLVLLHTHNIMDWEFDIKENKNTLAILCKTKENAIKALKYMIVLSYAIIVLGVLNLNFNPDMLYVFLTLPIATKLLESIKDYINIKDVKFEPRWYWGFFENWKEIKSEKIDFFMFRFYLARNFSLFFAIFASIGVVS